MSENLQQSTYRILDASANRAGEGFRTMEELCRFVLDDAAMSAEFKRLRHGLASALSCLDRGCLLNSRDTLADVGTEIQEAAEYARSGMADVVAAAAVRAQQSLRVLEEYGKTIDPSMSAQVEQLRYQCYTATARLELRVRGEDRVARLRDSWLYVLVDAGPTEQDFVSLVERLAAGDVDVLQLRDRTVDDRTLIRRARLGTKIARSHQKLFLMNDRADLALAADTDGVHVGQEELPINIARQIVGFDRIIGVSTHSIEQARQAVDQGADYIGCGPVFPGRTKSFKKYVGTEYLSEVAQEITRPAFAIGGIDASNVDRVVEAGFRRIAVTGAVRDSDAPVAAAAELKARLQERVAKS